MKHNLSENNKVKALKNDFKYDDDVFICYSQKIADYLLKNGSKIKDIDASYKFSKSTVYIFENDKSIDINLTKYKNEVNKKTLFICKRF